MQLNDINSKDNAEDGDNDNAKDNAKDGDNDKAKERTGCLQLMSSILTSVRC